MYKHITLLTNRRRATNLCVCVCVSVCVSTYKTCTNTDGAPHTLIAMTAAAAARFVCVYTIYYLAYNLYMCYVRLPFPS